MNLNDQSCTASLTEQANLIAFERMLAVWPVWVDVAPANEALHLSSHQILHAGPPLADPRHPPQPVRSAIVLSCLYEGWAECEADAEALIREAKLDLLPAQEHGCVLPLASVVGPSSTLVGVADAAGGVSPVWSLLGSGPPPDIRFGQRDPGCLASMAYRDGALTDILRAALTRPLDLTAIAYAGLATGDELHARSAGATAALSAELTIRLSEEAYPLHELTRLTTMLAAMPGFFLTLWMAACRLWLSACEGVAHASLVTRIGANGESVGISLAHDPTRWYTAPATPPVGARLPQTQADLAVNGVIGDSAVVDAMGFGGMLTRHAPEVQAALADYLPEDFASRDEALMLAGHPAFATKGGARCGLDANRVAQTGIAPLVNIAMLAANGYGGLLGRGLYSPPVSLFREAVVGLGLAAEDQWV